MYRYWYQIIEAQKISLAVLAATVRLQFCLLFSHYDANNVMLIKKRGATHKSISNFVYFKQFQKYSMTNFHEVIFAILDGSSLLCGPGKI